MGRRVHICLLAALGMAGCGPSGDNAAAPPQAPTVGVSAVTPDLEAGKLALTKDDDKVQVGAKAEDALGIFPKPSTQALNVNTLPKGFPAETYAADGWEAVDGGEGFGMITTPVNSIKRVAVAIRRTRVESRDDADKVVAAYKNQLSPLTESTQESGELKYTFWEDGKNRLMILEAPAKGGKCQLTFALGIKSLLVPLRVDPSAVGVDIVSLAKSAAESPKSEPSKH